MPLPADLSALGEIAKPISVVQGYLGDFITAILLILGFIGYQKWKDKKAKAADPNGNADKQTTRLSIGKIETNQIEVISDIKAIQSELKLILKYVGQLHEWHDTKDPDGVFVWYVPGSVSRSISELKTTIENIKEVKRK